MRKTGFTLVEALVASTIGAFIALVSVGTLRTITNSAERVEANIKVAAEVRFVSNMIARDLLNLYRDQNIRNMKFVAMFDESGNSSILTFHTVGRAKARMDQPEGDIYEVEYGLIKKDEEESALIRRLWPNPDPNGESPGGILSEIAEDIEFFQARFFDGQEWSGEWPEDMGTIPQLVEINIVSKPPGRGTSPVMESVMVNLVSSTGALLETIESGEQSSSEQQVGSPQGGGPQSGNAPETGR